MSLTFEAWPKIPRLRRDCVITEKIDGTNSAVIVEPLGSVLPEEGIFLSREAAISYATTWDPNILGIAEVDGVTYAVGAQSRSRLITPVNDNHGFARWVQDNVPELVRILGPGRHFGEWWGQGIQRRYGQDRKRFSLFNTGRWSNLNSDLVDVVPVLYSGVFTDDAVEAALEELRLEGSKAAPGFMDPEGVVVFHTQSRQLYKRLLVNDDIPKGNGGEG